MKLKKLFENLEKKNESCFMAHVYYGDPNENFSKKYIKKLIENGIDILEFGIPFSDPTADGPTFIEACTRSIKNGTTPQKCIDALKQIHTENEIVSVVTTYYNIVFQYGIDDFFKAIKDAGTSGLIIPEMPFEESEELLVASKKYEIDLIFIIGPHSTDERIEEIIKRGSGFLYNAAVSGVTGARDDLNNSGVDMISKIKKKTDLPLLTGFGISKPEHVKSIKNSGGDGVIIGSAIAKIYDKHIENGKIIDEEKTLEDVGKFVKTIKENC